MSFIFNAFRILLALALLAILFLRVVNRESFLDSLQHLDGRFIAFTLVAYFLWRIASTGQMAYLLRRCGVAVPFWRVFQVQTIGLFFSTTFPSDFAGAAATWYMLSKDTGKRAVIANSMIYIRLLGLAAVAAFACVGLMIDPVLSSLSGARYVTILAGVLFACLLLPFSSTGLYLLERASIALLPKGPWRDRLRQALTNLFSEARSMRGLPWSTPVILSGYALLINLGAALIVFGATRAAAIPLPFAVSIWLVALITIIQIIPLTPGGLGVREASIIAVLKSTYGVVPAKALAFATLILVINLIFGVGLGGYWFLFSNRENR